jgi:hypothetical protein
MIEAGRLQIEACNKPARSRKGDLLACLIFSGVGVLFVLLRLISRWKLGPRYDMDDWIMMASGVCGNISPCLRIILKVGCFF